MAGEEDASRIEVPAEWHSFAAELKAAAVSGPPLRVYLLGEPDSGKSTFAAFLCDTPGSNTIDTWLLDGDPGQSVSGLPGTVGLAERRGGLWETTDRRFTGDVTPATFPLLSAAGMAHLARRNRAHILVVDPSGYLRGHSGRAYQLGLIDLLRPDFLVSIGGGTEVEQLLGQLVRPPGMQLRQLPRAAAARRRSTAERRRYRETRLRDYFHPAHAFTLDTRDLAVRVPGGAGRRAEPGPGLVCALCDSGQLILSLAVVTGIESEALQILAPPFPFERLAGLHIGAFTLNID